MNATAVAIGRLKAASNQHFVCKLYIQIQTPELLQAFGDGFFANEGTTVTYSFAISDILSARAHGEIALIDVRALSHQCKIVENSNYRALSNNCSVIGKGRLQFILH